MHYNYICSRSLDFSSTRQAQSYLSLDWKTVKTEILEGIICVTEKILKFTSRKHDARFNKMAKHKKKQEHVCLRKDRLVVVFN